MNFTNMSYIQLEKLGYGKIPNYELSSQIYLTKTYFFVIPRNWRELND